MSSLRSLLCALVIVCQAQSGLATEPDKADPSEFISKLGDRVMAILGSPDNRGDERKREIRKLFDEALDYQHMAKQVLGRFWMKISVSERLEFQGLFEDHVVAVYSAQFEQYAGERFEVLKHASWSDKTVTVWTVLKKKSGEAMPMSFRLRRHDGELRIFDLLVRGVSHVLIKRSEFNSVIINHGLPTLFDRLRASRRADVHWSRLAIFGRSAALSAIFHPNHGPREKSSLIER